MKHLSLLAVGLVLAAGAARADIGDPQTKTDHPWYPGELSCSTFERLFATQADLYKRVVGIEPKTDEQKALAAFLWRNTHYWHGTEGAGDYWGKGWGQGGDNRTRDYWTGLFGHGYGLCGTTHSQWTAEMEVLLGHGRGRGLGVEGHNSFEVWLTGGPYGDGKWVLLDHDISTVVYNKEGTALLSMPEVKADLKNLGNQKFMPEKQHGWIVAGLHPQDAFGVYTKYSTAEYAAGYAGPAPMVHLRRGETLRRIFDPGLEDGKTYVYWGQNLNQGGIPGPARPQTWVNQPEKMYQSKESSPYKDGRARYANAVYTYAPNFAGADYKEGVVDESDVQVTFEFYTPYVIGCTPADLKKEWGIYDAGGRNGLVLKGKATCPVAVSVDQGKTWKDAGAFSDGLDLTDHVKGYRQYLLRFGAGAKALGGSGLTIRTVCEVSVSTIPRLKDNGTKISFESSGKGIVSAGPTLPQAQAHVVDGAFGSRAVTLELATPRKEAVATIVAAAQVASSCPPSPDVKYQIEYSLDGGKSWKTLLKDWTVARRGDEPPDFWSQSMCYGSVDVAEAATAPVRVRFKNDGGKNYLRAELHLLYKAAGQDETKVTFDWKDDAGDHRESHAFSAGKPAPWELKTGKNVVTRWVEYEPQGGK
ncbi:MAG: hypothetical protein JO332_02460 [Planctomycetaceae bacterium]|nr:hypothetical protein [Planctomycetaceae bacterium]